MKWARPGWDGTGCGGLRVARTREGVDTVRPCMRLDPSWYLTPCRPAATELGNVAVKYTLRPEARGLTCSITWALSVTCGCL